MEALNSNLYVGTSGLVLPVPGKSHFPEQFREKSRLHYYSRLLNSVEINSSFYRIPQYSTVRKWAEDVPENFRFTFKLFKGFTHNRGLVFERDAVPAFFKVVSAVGKKKGCLLVQFPPGVGIAQFSKLRLLLESLQEYNLKEGWKIALEFRHSSLYCREVFDLLKAFGFSLVRHDMPAGGSLPLNDDPAFAYFRFHGPAGDYRGSYSQERLCEFAAYMKEALSRVKEVFGYFNNTIGQAYWDLDRLRSLL